MSKFTKGQEVKFVRNAAVKSDSTLVVSVVEMPKNEGIELKQSYIIEHEIGWLPNEMRVKTFVLDATKKYLFVSEDELTAI